MSFDIFPLQATVLSEDALGMFINKNYFSSNLLVSCRLFYRSIHDIYKVIAGNDVYYFKMYRQGFRSQTEIQSEIDLLNHIKSFGINVVYPIAQNDGDFIGQFQTVFGERYGVMYASVGVRSLDEIELTDKFNEKLGNYIATIHKSLDSFSQNFIRWELDTKTFIDDSMDLIKHFSQIHVFDCQFLTEVAQKTKEKLKGLSTDKPVYGLCHGDIYSGNIRVTENNEPVLFDFDFCGNGWRMYDISMYAYPFGMGFDSSEFDKREQRKNQFLNGYNKIRCVSHSELNNLPLFILFRRIFNIGTLYISLLHNTWGDYTTVQNIDSDIINIKNWLEHNPVI